MLLLGVLLAILIALLFGGRVKNIETMAFRAPFLPIAAVAIEYTARYLPVGAPGGWLMPVALCLSYGAVFLFIFLNRDKRKTALALGAGSLCNFLVIALNGFCMPVSLAAQRYMPSAVLTKLLSGGIPMYAAQTESTLLPFLGDILCLPALGLASVGDILLVIGAALWIFSALKPRLPQWLMD